MLAVTKHPYTSHALSNIVCSSVKLSIIFVNCLLYVLALLFIQSNEYKVLFWQNDNTSEHFTSVEMLQLRCCEVYMDGYHLALRKKKRLAANQPASLANFRVAK